MTPRRPDSITRSPARRAGAFTLLEMLVAISIVGLVGISLFASLRIAQRGKESAEEAVEPARTADIVFEMIRQDLENAQPPRGVLAGGYTGQNYLDDRGRDADTALFFTTATGFEHESGDGDLRRVEYLVLSPDGPEGDHLLVRRVIHNLLSPFEPPADDEILMRSLGGFNLKYFDGLTWTDTWESSQTNSIPLVVEVGIDIDRIDRTTKLPILHRFVRHIQLSCAVPQTDTSGLSR